MNVKRRGRAFTRPQIPANILLLNVDLDAAVGGFFHPVRGRDHKILLAGGGGLDPAGVNTAGDQGFLHGGSTELGEVHVVAVGGLRIRVADHEVAVEPAALGFAHGAGDDLG